MKNIVLLSDTHHTLDERFFYFIIQEPPTLKTFFNSKYSE